MIIDIPIIISFMGIILILLTGIYIYRYDKSIDNLKETFIVYNIDKIIPHIDPNNIKDSEKRAICQLYDSEPILSDNNSLIDNNSVICKGHIIYKINNVL